jgi:hypothetical protein
MWCFDVGPWAFGVFQILRADSLSLSLGGGENLLKISSKSQRYAARCLQEQRSVEI